MTSALVFVDVYGGSAGKGAKKHGEMIQNMLRNTKPMAFWVLQDCLKQTYIYIYNGFFADFAG